jgi:carbamoyltransferase
MVVDGVGSYRSDVMEQYPQTDAASPLARESESYYRFEGERLECLKKVFMEPSRGMLSDEFYNMPGLGALYSRVSTYVFGDWNKCGELMGLAPYGRREQVGHLLKMTDGKLNVPPWSGEFRQPYVMDSGSWEKNPAMSHWEDMAWRVQDDTENVLLARARWLRETTGAKNLCIAGGVALNCVANGRIAREAGFENVWIQPAAGDDGIAIGCAYYGWLVILNKRRDFVMEDAYAGRRYGDKEIAAALGNSWCASSRRRRSGNICAIPQKHRSAHHQLVRGPSIRPACARRRSLLADPRARDEGHLNSRVSTGAFRPFTPIVLAERMREILRAEDSPFMLIANRSVGMARSSAIVRDGSARVQGVLETNPLLYRLLRRSRPDEGAGADQHLIQRRGEPIVETPEDALMCFLTTGIDHLVLHDMLVSKGVMHRFVAPLVRTYSDVGHRRVNRRRAGGHAGVGQP